MTADLSYTIVTILYPAPGNLSEIDYAVGSSAGSSEEITHTTQTGIAFDIGVNFDDAGGADAQGKWTKGTTTGNGWSFSNSMVSGVGLMSTSDVTSHLDDEFFLWLNPELVATEAFTDSINIAVGPARLAPGEDGALHDTTGPDGLPSMVTQTITARELIDPTQISAARRGLFFRLSASDFNDILAQDPFFQRSSAGVWTEKDPTVAVADTTRFRFLGPSLGHQMLFGPSSASPGAAIPETQGKWEYDSTMDQIDGSVSHFEVQITAGPSIGPFSAKFGGAFSLDYADTRTDTQGIQKEADSKLETSTPCLVADVTAYLDLAMGTFAMVPNVSNFTCNAPCQKNPQQQNNTCECRVDTQCPVTGCNLTTHMCR